jgi:hypothetical protein
MSPVVARQVNAAEQKRVSFGHIGRMRAQIIAGTGASCAGRQSTWVGRKRALRIHPENGWVGNCYLSGMA